DPHRLELEITENVLMRDIDRAQAALLRVKELGVRIAMDDFGTGYSSLAYLQRIPFDRLKIDRTFVATLEESEHGAGDRRRCR
ncbi:EAL domain-containing protein, partial [Mycobacterium tuberculosis]|nr:EAL domain-containing protein [Mycobacterium tuberculosis]